MQDYSCICNDCYQVGFFPIPCIFLLKLITNLIHPRQNLFVQGQHKHMLSGVSFQLHLFQAALIPFPAPGNIHSSQHPHGGLQAQQVPPSQCAGHCLTPWVTGGAPHTLPHLWAKPKAATSVRLCALLPSTGNIADKPPIAGHSTGHLTNISSSEHTQFSPEVIL